MYTTNYSMMMKMTVVPHKQTRPDVSLYDIYDKPYRYRII